MENKYITVAYKLYAVEDGKKELREEAPAAHPFQFISGIGYTLDRFEKKSWPCKRRQLQLHHSLCRSIRRKRRRQRTPGT